jgi:hypothetical protein
MKAIYIADAKGVGLSLKFINKKIWWGICSTYYYYY